MKKYHSILIAFFLILVSQSCADRKVEQNKSQSESVSEDIVVLNEEQSKFAGIETGSLEKKSLSTGVSVTGMLDVPPQNLVNITAPFGGFLRSTALLQGMHVVKGQVIATIENPDYIQLQQDFLDTKSQLEFLEIENKRQEELAKENVNSQKTLQKSRADLESMKARNNGLRAKLKMLNLSADKLTSDAIRSVIELHSPINGYVTQVNTTIGAFVNPTEVMFQIVDTEHLHAELTAFERDIPRIKIGQRILFTLANETTVRSAKVYLIGREISKERTVRIHGHLDEEDAGLMPGMFLKATIETGNEIVLSLPEESVVHYEGKNYIFITDKEHSQTFKMTEVQTGLTENGFIEIKPQADISTSTLIVKTGAYKLLSQLKNEKLDD